MIETIFSSGSLATPNAFIISLIIGSAFGWCLEQAGFGSSRRITGVFYLRDMALLKVLFSAVVTAMLGLGIAFSAGFVHPESLYIPETILGAQLLGGFIFGIGFVMGGWCPGSALVGVASGRFDAIIFIVGILLGSFLFNAAFPLIEPWYNWGDIGVSFIFRESNFSFGDFSLLVTVLAVFIFWFSELIEEKFNFRRIAERNSGLWAFSVVLLVGAVLVMGVDRAGRVGYKVVETGVYAAEIMNQAAEGKDYIEPDELAREMLAGQKKIAVIDLRSREEFIAWHINGSYNIPANNLVKGLERFRDFEMIVLVSNDSLLSGQAWVVLKVFDYHNVVILSQGLRGFFERVLKPVSLRMENHSEEQKAEINNWRAMFLGSGMAVGSASPPSSSMR